MAEGRVTMAWVRIVAIVFAYAAAVFAPVAVAQSGGSDEDRLIEEVVVVGLRSSLQTALDRKQEAFAITDSLVAEDIGKFPDNTVSDALQRVTGVQVRRGAGEVNEVLIRGLPNFQSYINGREVFTGTGRGFALQDIPAELVAAVDVYKSPLPSQVGGGIAGLIDVRLRKPFDFDGRAAAGSARGIYGEQRDAGSYVASALYSDVWEVGTEGRFGFLVSGSYNDRKYRDDTAFNFWHFPTDTFDPRNGLLDSETGLPVLIPDTVGSITRLGDRERPAANFSLQYAPNQTLEFWLDGVYAGYEEEFDVNFFVGLPRATGAPVSARSAIGNGQVVTRTYPGSGPIDVTFARRLNSVDNFTITSKQAFNNETDNYQLAGGTEWTNGPWTVSGEASYDDSKVLVRNAIVDVAFNAPVFNVNFDNKGTPSIDIQGVDITDPANFNIITLFDDNSKAVSEQWALRGDVTYELFDVDFIDNIQFGVRYADRDVENFATATGPLPIPATPAANFAPEIFEISPDDVIDGRALGEFFLPNSGWIRDNVDVVRGLAGRPPGDPPFRLSEQFSHTETTLAAYLQTEYRFMLGDVEVRGLAGARVINTENDLGSFAPPIDPVTGESDLTAPLVPVSDKTKDTDVLPNIMARAYLREDLVLRLGASKSITKPEFLDLNPAVSLFLAGQTGGSNTGTGGNPALEPVESINYDAALEWYFGPAALLAASAFHRDVTGFVNGVTTEEVLDGQTFFITRPRNAGDGTLTGLEMNYQQFFDTLPAPFDGFGVQLNLTYIDGEQEDPVTGEDVEFPTVSEWSYNVVAMYEKHGISARLAYNWRDEFIDSFQNGDQPSPVVTDSIGFLDFSASYEFTERVTITFDATNLLDTEYQDRFEDNQASVPRDTRQYDRTFGAGVRVRL